MPAPGAMPEWMTRSPEPAGSRTEPFTEEANTEPVLAGSAVPLLPNSRPFSSPQAIQEPWVWPEARQETASDQSGQAASQPVAGGLKGALARLTCGVIRTTPRPIDIQSHRRRTLERIIRDIDISDLRVIAVMGAKGGIGKTATAANLATLLALLKPDDRVLAIDSNTDAGTLASIMPLQRRAGLHYWTLRELGENLDGLRSYGDYKKHIPFTKENGGVGVISSGVSAGNDLDDQFWFERIQKIIQRVSTNFNIVVLDLGTDRTRPLTLGALAETHQLIMVTEPDYPGLKVTNESYDFFQMSGDRKTNHGSTFKQLGDEAILVVNNIESGIDAQAAKAEVARGINPDMGGIISFGGIQRMFAERGEAVLPVSHEPVIKTRQRVAFEEYAAKTQLDYMELAAQALLGLRRYDNTERGTS